MAKKQTIVKMFGVLADGTRAQTHNAADVVAFTNATKTITAEFLPGSGDWGIETVKDRYVLREGNVQNLWQGVCNGVKVHFTHKKLVAKLIYWS